MKRNATILLVEDDAVDVMIIKRAFERWQITNPIQVAADGEEALEFLRGEGGFPDPNSVARASLILLDLNMPRMSGLELLLALKRDSDLREIPVVVLTASDEPSDVRASFARGAAGYVVKPTSFEDFSDAIGAIDHYWALSEVPGGAG